MYSYVYSMCDFVFPCESSMQIRIKFKQETAAVKCKEPMVLFALGAELIFVAAKFQQKYP